MKYLLCIVLLNFSNTIFSQNSSNINQSIDTSGFLNYRWDLNKFVWSQTHVTTSKRSKPALDFDIIDNWQILDHSLICLSPDGKYFCYSVYKFIEINGKRDNLLTIQSTDGLWRKSFTNAKSGFFSVDSKQFIFMLEDDLIFLRSGSDEKRSVKSVTAYKQSTKDNCEWIAYKLGDTSSTVILENLLSRFEKQVESVSDFQFDKGGRRLFCLQKGNSKGLFIYELESQRERYFPNVTDYYINESGTTVILKEKSTKNEIETISLGIVSMPDGQIKSIWQTTDTSIKINTCELDKSGNQVVINVAECLHKRVRNSIWYFIKGMDKASLIVNNDRYIELGLNIRGSVSFSGNGQYIQVDFQHQGDSVKRSVDPINVDIWNFKDSILLSTQSVIFNGTPKSYRGILLPGSNKPIYLEKDGERIYMIKGDFLIVSKSKKEVSDRFWEKDYYQDSVWLISLKNGLRSLLPIKMVSNCWFSPKGKYLIYFDPRRKGHYFSYNLNTGKQVKISTGVQDWKLCYKNNLNRDADHIIGEGIAGWMEDDDGVLVYDKYDIWQLDLAGKKTAVNVTNGVGQKNQTLLCLVNGDRLYTNDLLFNSSDTLLLKAFNTTNKYNGFYQKKLNSKVSPEMLYMGACFFQNHFPLDAVNYGMEPIKASAANIWIVERQTATDAPNYYLTTDFKTYSRLTNLGDHKRYNWLCTELHSFKRLDGTVGQGILYKPENFDSSKRYPVVISFYQEMSSRLYQFPSPTYLIRSSICDEPAWLVSHGYLVFIPDMHFIKGQWGPSIINTVVGAAKYLSRQSFVDAKFLGAAGHSNGGRFGYYVLSHSNCFSAFSVGSGTSNIISSALGLNTPQTSIRFNDGNSRLEWGEYGTYGGGIGELWKNKYKWIDHSAVLNADKVTTPVLIFHNRIDDAFAPGQGSEMFIALRRLNKPTWWLQYDDEGHALDKLKDERDYTIRLTQFFDHYLKEAPAPVWMTNGISYSLKGRITGYELDSKGKCFKGCKVCNIWNVGVRK